MHVNAKEKDGFRTKLWRGERMCLVGMDVDEPEDDLAGFAIEVKRPGADDYVPLRNRLAFSYPDAAARAVTGARQFPSTEAPFQKFRWVHFPYDPQPGAYRYRATKMHMPRDGALVKGTSITVDLPLDPVTYHDFLDIGFTRNFASSQAYGDKFGGRTDLLPETADDGLEFAPPAGTAPIYKWLGFEAAEQIFDLLDEALADPRVTLDVFAYDLNVGAIVERLERMGHRLRILIDNSANHAPPHSAESKAAERLRQSGAAVKRIDFRNLQHHKVLIAKRNGTPCKVLLGSTNFSYRGLYIQANNALVFTDANMAALFEAAFEQSWADDDGFAASPLAKKWHLIEAAGRPPVSICLSPHSDTDLSLNPVGAAIDTASSSVFYSIAFLNQTKSGAVRGALDRLIDKPVFSYGAINNASAMKIRKPDGSIGLVDFAYLARTAPPPFRAEWYAGKGINVHNKFVITDFNLPTAKVFTGSCNLSPSGEKNNGDHLLMIEDSRVATAYAIEAVRLFDHLHFRVRMRDAGVQRRTAAARPHALTLAKPSAISGRGAWFERFYAEASQHARDRMLFGR